MTELEISLNVKTARHTNVRINARRKPACFRPATKIVFIAVSPYIITACEM